MTAQPKRTRQPSAKKKRYTKPRVIYRQPLEARASACTPAGPGGGKSTTGGPYQCGQNYLFS